MRKKTTRHIQDICRYTSIGIVLKLTEIHTFRVARWFVFKPKIPIWVNFGVSCNGKSWYILWPFCLLFCYWKYFRAIWYILWSFSIFFHVLVFCTKKNLATLILNEIGQSTYLYISFLFFLFSTCLDILYKCPFVIYLNPLADLLF
jgi:hypothetical protein